MSRFLARRLRAAFVMVRLLMAGPHLRVYVLPDRHSEVLEVPEGRSLDEELSAFLARDGRFSQDWVPLRESGGVTKYVRYDQIVQVEARLG